MIMKVSELAPSFFLHPNHFYTAGLLSSLSLLVRKKKEKRRGRKNAKRNEKKEAFLFLRARLLYSKFDSKQMGF